jgi:hypothetical protein
MTWYEHFHISLFTSYLVFRLMEGAWWTFFRWFRKLWITILFQTRSLLSTVRFHCLKHLHQSYRRDIRFWIPMFSLDVQLVGPNLSPPRTQSRARSRLYDHHYGIWLRLRWRFQLIRCCERKRRRATKSQSDVEIATPHPEQPDHDDDCDHSLNSCSQTDDSSQTDEEDADLDDSDYEYYFDRVTAGYKDGIPKHESGPPTFQQYYGMTSKAAMQYLLKVIDPLEWFLQQKRLSLSIQSVRQSNMFQRAFLAAAQILKDIDHPRNPLGEQHGVFLQGHHNHNQREVPIVIDTGASFSLTPYLEDFQTPLEPSKLDSLLGLNGTAKIEGVAWVEWEIRDWHGQVAILKTKAYYVPSANIRIFSPQAYFAEYNKGFGWFNHECMKIHTVDDIEITFPYAPNNLPLMYLNEFFTSVGLVAGVTAPLAFTLRHTDALSRSQELLHDLNVNLKRPQKEVMMWHYRLSHAGLGWIQDLMYVQKGDHGEESAPPIIPSKHSSTKRCDMEGIKCPACLLAKQHRKPTESKHVSIDSKKEMAIRRDAMRPGEEISGDQYVCRSKGRLASTFGKENDAMRYHGGTIFVDHYSGFTFIGNQVSLGIGETLKTKRAFERFAAEHGVNLQHFRLDNQPFDSQAFREDLEDNGQTVSFSGVGAHHQNGVAERAQGTIFSWTRAQMMHQLLHWPEQADDTLWPFSLENAVYIWNHLPDRTSGLTPYEKFTGKKLPNSSAPLLRTRVWGCPSFVLDPKLQDGHKLPKFKKRSRCGVYLGHSMTHSTNVGLILNPETGHISPQFHVVYDELFSTVYGTVTDGVFDADQWQSLIELKGEEHSIDPNDRDDPEVLSKAIELFRDYEIDSDPPTLCPTDSDSDSDSCVSEGDDPQQDDEETFGSEGDSDNHIKLRSGRRVPRKQDANFVSTLMLPSKYEHKPANQYSAHVQQLYLAGGNPKRRVPLESVHNADIHGIDWNPTTFLTSSSFDTRRALRSLLRAQEEGLAWHPQALAAKGEDPEFNPTWEQAMNGPLADGYKEAARKEIEILKKMGCWEEVDREPWMNVLPSTWAFKKKVFPSGLVRKLKARFCARGDRQIENVDYFSTYAPVVSWTTVRLLLILSVQLSLETKQVDYTSAFVHAEIDKPPNFDTMSKEEQERTGVYVEMPRGFLQKGKVLKLKKSLYGLKQSPRNFFHHLKSKLERVGFEQAIDIDPCLFISDKVICLVYVDDTLLFARDMKDIDNVLSKLVNEQGMGLEVEDSVAGFLGVHIKRDEKTSKVTLTQPGLIERIVDALGCRNLPAVSTPADRTLGRDEDGDPPTCTFNFASVIGMSVSYTHLTLPTK